MNKKIFLSLLLVLLVAMSVSVVSAESVDDAVVTDAGANEAIATDAGANDAAVTDAGTEEVVAEGESTGDPFPDATEIQGKIDAANEGDTIELDENRVYNVGATNFNIEKNITIKGNGATINVNGSAQGGVGATFYVVKNGTTFERINFVNNNGHMNYGQEVSGYGIQLQDVSGVTISNCKFIDFNSGIYGGAATLCTISECYFNGSAEYVTGKGKGEKGTKAINLMGCTDMLITKCNFDGQVLDGVSSASNSGNLKVLNNTFNNNVYAIFFGGASTQGAVIANNTFTNCGHCIGAAGTDIFKGLPTISTQKAANGYTITENKFYAGENAILIAAESGNTAHGYPSKIGDINITSNIVSTASGEVSPESVTFVHILSNAGPLNPYAPIAVTGNTIEAGITPVKVWYKDWGSETGDATIPATPKAPTFISVEKVATADNEIIVKLEDTNGEALQNKVITYSIAGGEQKTVTTDANGLATISDLTDGEIALSYAGDAQTGESSATVTFTSTKKERLATEIIASDMTTNAIVPNVDIKKGKYFKVTLKDSEGIVLAKKAVQIGFNGVVYNLKTDENGQAQLQINLGYKGVYTFAICFLGDEQYKASFKVCKITVNPQTASLTVPNKSYKASATTKTLTATFKSAHGNLIAGKKITFTVNGKNYSAKTNAKGVASVKVSLNKKGTYKFTAKFAGDSTIAAITKKATLTLK